MGTAGCEASFGIAVRLLNRLAFRVEEVYSLSWIPSSLLVYFAQLKEKEVKGTEKRMGRAPCQLHYKLTSDLTPTYEKNNKL